MSTQGWEPPFWRKDTSLLILFTCLHPLLSLLPNQTWVGAPVHSEANLLIPGCSEGKCSIGCSAPCKESRQLLLKIAELLDDFQGKVFKDRVRERGWEVLDQLVDILLIGWRWGDQGSISTSSNFWVPLIWGLCACGQHTVNFFSLVGANYKLVLAQGICHLSLWRLNPVPLQLPTFNTPRWEFRVESEALWYKEAGGTGL